MVVVVVARPAWLLNVPPPEAPGLGRQVQEEEEEEFRRNYRNYSNNEIRNPSIEETTTTTSPIQELIHF